MCVRRCCATMQRTCSTPLRAVRHSKMWRFQIYGHLAKAHGHRDSRFARRLLWEGVGRELAGFWLVLVGCWEGAGSELGMPALGDSVFCLRLEE